MKWAFPVNPTASLIYVLLEYPADTDDTSLGMHRCVSVGVHDGDDGFGELTP